MHVQRMKKLQLILIAKIRNIDDFCNYSNVWPRWLREKCLLLRPLLIRLPINDQRWREVHAMYWSWISYLKTNNSLLCLMDEQLMHHHLKVLAAVFKLFTIQVNSIISGSSGSWGLHPWKQELSVFFNENIA